MLVNVDAVPGAANRLLGRFATASAVGWAGNPLPRAVVTGTPVRPEIGAVDRSRGGRAAARRRSGSRRPPVVVVFGGSLGARRINRAVDGAAVRWSDRDDLAIYHIVGRRDWDAYWATRPSTGCRRRARPPVTVSTWSGSPTSSAWPPSTPLPTWWCAGPGP